MHRDYHRRPDGQRGEAIAARYSTIIRGVRILDGSGARCTGLSDVAIVDGWIDAIGDLRDCVAERKIDGRGLTLAPGFIDVHTHDDTAVIDAPEMLPKLSQGITTVIVGNCGISAAPVGLMGELPDPMNLLGDISAFRYPRFEDYVTAVAKARPSVNVAALVGHTALRNNHMDRLDRTAMPEEIARMRAQLREALDQGAFGLSTGLAYLSANSASTEEVMALAEPLAEAGAVYTTHLRSETDAVLDAMEEAFRIGRYAGAPVVVSHLKCAGVDNWGRSGEVLAALEGAAKGQRVQCDCYPYAAGSSTLDLRQVDERVEITITWSGARPEVAGLSLRDIADQWGMKQVEAARALLPAGAIYHSISEDDMRAILRHPLTMVGSDGLPHDPRPHPRLWGTFPRVLGRYCRELALFPMAEAIRKMTGLPAQRFGLGKRGLLREGYRADLVLFNADTVMDRATYDDPTRQSIGIEAVWVNGVLSFEGGVATGDRGGQFLAR